MKTVTIVRHAKSAAAAIGQNDFERPLNERGLNDAALMAQRIFEKNILIQQFISSPALRAKQTCMAFCNAYHYNPDGVIWVKKLYQAPLEVFTDVVGDLDDAIDHVAVFAHNPGITQFANHLLGHVALDNMPTCGVLSIVVNINNWKAFTTAEKQYLFFDFPKNLPTF